MLSLTQIKKQTYIVVNEIIAGDTSNNKAFELYSLVGLYNSLGGKEDLMRKFISMGLLHHLPTEQAKINYTFISVKWISACTIYLTLTRYTKTAVKRHIYILLMSDVVAYVNEHCKDLLHKYNIKFDMLGLNTVKVILNGINAKIFDIHSVKDIEDLYISTVESLTDVKFSPYMVNILNNYLITGGKKNV